MLQFYLQLLDTAAEKEKFEKLYEQYRKLMMAEANAILKSKHLAEDAVQETFLRIIKTALTMLRKSCRRERSGLW